MVAASEKKVAWEGLLKAYIKLMCHPGETATLFSHFRTKSYCVAALQADEKLAVQDKSKHNESELPDAASQLPDESKLEKAQSSIAKRVVKAHKKDKHSHALHAAKASGIEGSDEHSQQPEGDAHSKPEGPKGPPAEPSIAKRVARAHRKDKHPHAVHEPEVLNQVDEDAASHLPERAGLVDKARTQLPASEPSIAERVAEAHRQEEMAQAARDADTEVQQGKSEPEAKATASKRGRPRKAKSQKAEISGATAPRRSTRSQKSQA